MHPTPVGLRKNYRSSEIRFDTVARSTLPVSIAQELNQALLFKARALDQSHDCRGAWRNNVGRTKRRPWRNFPLLAPGGRPLRNQQLACVTRVVAGQYFQLAPHRRAVNAIHECSQWRKIEMLPQYHQVVALGCPRDEA
jgi:hypothetical protein